VPHLFRVIVPVSDIERAALFYSALLGAAGSRVSPGRHYFECEGTILACYDPQADGDGRDAKPLPEPIYFAVDDLESIYVKCRDGRRLVLIFCRSRRGSPWTDRAETLGRAIVLCGRSVRQSAVLR
jgi:catechol 2,3-dioxygenase-like lactoylglutathione lyase family enzyme